MAVKKVLQFGDPRLRAKCSRASFGSGSNRRIMLDLRDTLLNLQKIHGKGGGLAAPQLGCLERIIFVSAKGRSFYIFNPRITEKSKRMFNVWDFCFSNNASFLARISRHYRVTVEFQDENGENQRETFSGYFSELFQHEIDHLNGVLFIDHIRDPSSIVMMEEWDRQLKHKQH